MSLANLPYEVIYDVVSLLDFPTLPRPKKSSPDFAIYEKFHKITGPWNQLLLDLKYLDIKKSVYEEVTVDFGSRELRFYPQQECPSYHHEFFPVSFDEKLSRIQKIQAKMVTIDGNCEPSPNAKKCPIDLKHLAGLFQDCEDLNVQNLTAKNRYEGEFINHLKQTFRCIKIRNVKGHAKTLKKFLPIAFKFKELFYVELTECAAYKGLQDDVLNFIKSLPASEKRRNKITIEKTQSFAFDFYKSLMDWWKETGAGQKLIVNFRIKKAAKERMLETVQQVRRFHTVCHENSKNSAFVFMENVSNVCVTFQ
ncbi:hypothetical protein L596_026126 [Steinernema carpocapsae]|uniref:F-box domain-containing protein n=1 Tax=Steinernema carpocapsae TaxID=34508 RepID=A0A4U5M0H6_STECR|nr:hypothetical protein L596_026126 [Steinernema carpocapsae]